jgi:hypothetical protein
MPDGFGYPANKAELQGWVDNGNLEKMREHAWDIWAAMTAPSDQTYNAQALPVWETWFSGTDVYINGPLDVDEERAFPRHFEQPVQLTHESLDLTGQDNPEEVTSFNKFTRESAEFIWDNKYYLQTTLNDLNASWSSNTAIQDRAIKNFPDKAIATKPVFTLVKQDTLNALPYWAGISNETTTNKDAPTPSTWKQCAVIDTSGESAPGTEKEVDCNGQTVMAEVVELSDFYHFQLTQAEIDNLSSQAAPEFAGAVAGDYAVFVAMHVTTREIDNWTWQTFWWSPDPEGTTLPPYPPTESQAPVPSYPNFPGSGGDRPDSVKPPWDNYIVCTAYSMVVPPQPRLNGTNEGALPQICFNPYLETSFSTVGKSSIPGTFSDGGINSNCMSCHGRATWGGKTTGYVSNGYYARNSEDFSTTTQLDFSWNVTRARSGE